VALADSDVKALVAAALKTTVDQLEPFWDAAITRGNVAAYNLIRAALVTRGFTPAQIDAWDSIDDYRADLALWSIFTKYAVLEEYDQRSIDALDRREELKTVELITAGKLVQPPADPLAKQVGSGTLSEAGTEFRRQRDLDPDSPGWFQDRR